MLIFETICPSKVEAHKEPRKQLTFGGFRTANIAARVPCIPTQLIPPQYLFDANC